MLIFYRFDYVTKLLGLGKSLCKTFSVIINIYTEIYIFFLFLKKDTLQILANNKQQSPY